MRIFLTGVLEDGSPRRAGVPENPRTNLSVTQGTDATIEVSVVTPGGTPVSLSGSDELLLTVKKEPIRGRAFLSLVAELTGNTGTFTLTPNDTRRLTPGLFGYDVWLTRGGLRDPVIPLSPFQLLAANTT